MNDIRGYMGDPVHAAPPSGDQWTPIDRTTATPELEEVAAGLMGDLPAYHYTDRMLPSGLYRFFAYETPIGNRVSAQKFTGTMGLGTIDTGSTTDGTGDAPAPQLTSDPNNLAANLPDTVLATPDGSANLNSDAGNTNPDTSVNDGGGTPIQVQGSGGNTTGGGGTTTHEPVPPPNASCGAWTASTSNAQIVALANSISYSNTPVAWADQAIYYTKASDGSQWALAQWWEGGSKMVAAYSCSSPASGSGSGTTMSTGMIAGIALAVVGAATGIGLAVASHQKKATRHAA
jgi:hypothetical protein